MTTIVDPGGIPSPKYNRSGKTIQSLTGVPSPGSLAAYASAVHYSERDIVLFTSGGGNYGEFMLLPLGCDIGDVVEVYMAVGGGSSGLVGAGSGETILGNSTIFQSTTGLVSILTGPPFGGGNNVGAVFTKISSTDWQVRS